MPKKQTKPKGRGAAKRPRSGALRANLAFCLLTVFILAASGASSAWAAARIANPSGQLDSFAALPVYNVIGQRTDRLEFWPRARYHDLARANGYPLPFTAQQALEETGFQELLLNLIGSCTYISSLSGLEEAGQMACYSYYTDSVICRFYDDIPVQLLCEGGTEPFVYQGVLNASSGRGNGTDQLCYTALITPDDSMTPATEEQFQQAYQTILEHLMLLTGDTGSAPYYSCGPLNTALSIVSALFPYVADYANSVEEAIAWENASDSGYPSVMSTLNLIDQLLTQINMANELSPCEWMGVAEPDRSDPEEVERFLQNYFRDVLFLDLQILRQDDCYLILFQSSTNVLGLYYDPLLKTYTGFGIQ